MSGWEFGPTGYVMTEQALTVLMASAFTFGCALIEIAERHAQALAAVLLLVVLSPGPFVGLVALAHKAEPSIQAEQPAAVQRLR